MEATAVGGTGQAGRACLLLPWATLDLRTNMALIAGNLLEQAVALDTPAPGVPPTTHAGLEAKLMLGWLRERDGLDPMLSPELAARLGDVSIPDLTRQLREHPDCSTLGGPRPLPGEVSTPYDPPGSLHAIPPGKEALFLRMLGGEALAGCSLEGAEIQSSLVRARYVCAGGQRAIVELHHPSEAANAPVKTAKFAVVAGDAAPPEALIPALAGRIRAGEGAFDWLIVTRGDGDPAPLVAAPARSSTLRRAALGAGVVLGGLLLVLGRRRRARASRRSA
jgi:hypothetical protein